MTQVTKTNQISKKPKKEAEAKVQEKPRDGGLYIYDSCFNEPHFFMDFVEDCSEYIVELLFVASLLSKKLDDIITWCRKHSFDYKSLLAEVPANVGLEELHSELLELAKTIEEIM